MRGAEPEALFTGIFFCWLVCHAAKHIRIAILLLAVVLLRWSQFQPAPLQPSAVRHEARLLASSRMAELLPPSAERADPAVPSFGLDTEGLRRVGRTVRSATTASGEAL